MILKYIKPFLLFTLIFGVLAVSVSALESSYWFDTSGYYQNVGSPAGSVSGSWSNLADEDGVDFTMSAQKQYRLVFSTSSGSPWALPANANILGVSILAKYKITTAHGASNFAAPYVTNNITAGTVPWVSSSASGCLTAPAGDDPFDCGFWSTSSITNYDEEETYWRNYDSSSPYYLTAEHINNGDFGASVYSTDSTARDRSFDYVRIRIWYDLSDASIDVTESTASASLGNKSINVSGYIPISPITDDTWCQVSLYESCTATGKAGFTSSAPVTKLRMYGSSATCSQSPPSLYCSSGFDGNYDFTGIEVPFRSGYTCTYPNLVQCYERSCSTVEYWSTVANDYLEKQVCDDYDTLLFEQQGVFPDQPNYNPDLVVAPEATIDAPEDLQPDCENDPICAVTSSIKSFFTWLFIPDSTALNLGIQDYRDVLSSKAPFAYIYAFLNSNFSTPTDTSDFAFVLSVDFDGNTYNQAIPEGFTAFQTIIDALKNVLIFLIYAIFIFYLIKLPNRVLPQ